MAKILFEVFGFGVFGTAADRHETVLGMAEGRVGNLGLSNGQSPPSPQPPPRMAEGRGGNFGLSNGQTPHLKFKLYPKRRKRHPARLVGRASRGARQLLNGC